MYHQFIDIPTYENHEFTPSSPFPHILIPPLLLPSSCHTPHTLPSPSHTPTLISSPSHPTHSHILSHPTLILSLIPHLLLSPTHTPHIHPTSHTHPLTPPHSSIPHPLKPGPIPSHCTPLPHSFSATKIPIINKPHPPQLACDAMNIIKFTCTCTPLPYLSLVWHHTALFYSIRLCWPKVPVSC